MICNTRQAPQVYWLRLYQLFLFDSEHIGQSSLCYYFCHDE